MQFLNNTILKVILMQYVSILTALKTDNFHMTHCDFLLFLSKYDLCMVLMSILSRRTDVYQTTANLPLLKSHLYYIEMLTVRQW